MSKQYDKKKKTNMFLKVFSISFILLLSSCTSPENNTKSAIENWVSKEIIIPPNIIYKSIGCDTISKYIFDQTFKILVYVDSVGCTSCKLGLIEWKAFIDRCQSKGYDIGFLFVIQSSNYEEFEQKMEMYQFLYPVIYDLTDKFNSLNKFPKEDKFRTFLLDSNNKVILIGSPIKSDKMWKLYIDIIGKWKKHPL